MKKNVIALLLSVAMASVSILGTPALAAETTDQQEITAEEEASIGQDETSIESADHGSTDEGENAETEEPVNAEDEEQVTSGEEQIIDGDEAPDHTDPEEAEQGSTADEAPAAEEEGAQEEDAVTSGEEIGADTDVLDETVETVEQEAVEESAKEAVTTVGLSVAQHSQSEIRQYIRNHPAPMVSNVYDEEPSSVQPYALGKLSSKSLTYALNALNQMRYIAGIGDHVELNDSYNELTQAAALVNAANDALSHYPAKPEGMDDALYNLGSSGASSSNIAMGTDSLVYSVRLWMDDSDSSNIDALGHRRWALNPTMTKTGFGAVGRYSAMYSFDRNGSNPYQYVAWPGQNMPTEYFDSSHAWTLSFTGNASEADIHVTLTRQSDGKTWNFSSDSSDGFFNYETSGYGTGKCVIFRPSDVSYNNGDHFDVEITGINDEMIRYSVDFFDLCGGSHDYVDEVLSEPTCTEDGYTSRSCMNCGKATTTVQSKLGHSYQPGTGTMQDGLLTIICDRCGEEITDAVVTDFTAFWRDNSSQSYSYSSVPPSGLEAGAVLDLWCTNLKYSTGSSTQFDKINAESDDPDHCSIERTGSGSFLITFSEAGTYTITMTSAYNPEAVRTQRVRIVKPLNSVALTADHNDLYAYGPAVTLTATPDGGKGTLYYTFVEIAEDGTETTLRASRTQNTYSWKPEVPGMHHLRVDVADSADPDTTRSSEVLDIEVGKARLTFDGTSSGETGPVQDGTLVYGQKLSEVKTQSFSFKRLSSTVNVPGTLTFDDPDKVLPAGTNEVSWTFTPDDSSLYEALTGGMKITVLKAKPSVAEVPAAETLTYHRGMKLSESALSGGSVNADGHWEWKEADILLKVPGGNYTATFVPDDAHNYETTESTVSVTVKKAAPYWGRIEAAAIQYGQSLSESALSGAMQQSASDDTAVDGSFAWEDGEEKPTVRDNETTAYTVIFTPADTNNYETVKTQITVKIQKALQPASVPPQSINVPFSTETVTDQILVDAGVEKWSWGSYIGTALTAGESRNVTAQYIGEDKGNYEIETVEITLKRSSCEHNGETQVRGKKDATCEEDGETGSKYCLICGEELESSVTIPATGHAWNDGEVTKEATCIATGTMHYICLHDASHTKDEEIDVNPANHQGETEVRGRIEATCEEEGYTGETYCADCGALIKEGTAVQALGHNWGEWVTVKEATEEETGLEERTCLRDETHEETRIVDKVKKEISRCVVTGIANKTYNGKELLQSSIVVTDGETVLQEGTDYAVRYENNKNAGTASVIIYADEDAVPDSTYTGSITKTFTIAKAANKITGSNYTRSYSAKAQSLTLNAKATGGKLTYKSNKPVVRVTTSGKVTIPAKFSGTATITVTAGNGNYKTVTKKIYVTVPTKTVISRAVNLAGRKMKVTWKKNTAVTGYQVQYSLKSNFAKAKTVPISKNSRTSTTISKLLKGKKYYVRIRSFKTVSGKKYYSAWSAVKSATIKK